VAARRAIGFHCENRLVRRKSPPDHEHGGGAGRAGPPPHTRINSGGDLVARLGLALDLVERDPGGELGQRHPRTAALLVDGEDPEIGDHHVDDAGAGERQVAFVQKLGLVLGGVLHDHHHLLDARHQVHGAAHALHHLAGDHPVGEVAVLGHLHGAQEREVDMAAADHGEGIGGGEIAGRRDLGDGLLARIDEVGILLALIGERAEAEHAVLALQLHAHAVGDVVRHQGRDADAEIDVEAVAQLLGGARRHLVAGPGH
jgi:hypothetical protein